MSTKACDVAIVGGGPAGSTAAAMLRKYAPELSVLVLEREIFPREHVGESLLPVVSSVLHEMGCWDQIEAANFPVKIGATYRWGSSDDLWDFDFLNGAAYEDTPRPSKYEGQRTQTAFQVDRSVYDKILLDHARSLGALVQEGTSVRTVATDGDRIKGLVTSDGETISAKHYLDCTGHSAILRRALGVGIEEPSALRNIAIWSYWQNADWAVNIGVSGTRIQIMSLGWGWLWFIPLGPNRTSLGLVLPAEYFKKLHRKPEDLYLEAVFSEPRIRELLLNATREGDLYSTKDWSFVSSRIEGENWLLVGEAAGFADPILSAGLTLTHVGAKEAAITVAEIERGQWDAAWLRHEYERQQTRRLLTHIRFADFWYTANAHFTDLIEYTRRLASDAGLSLDGKNAWQWLGSGGFVDADMGGAGIGGFSLLSASWLVNDFSQEIPKWQLGKNNVFHLNTEGAEKTFTASYQAGRVEQIPALARNGRILPTDGVCGFLLDTVANKWKIGEVLQEIESGWCSLPGVPSGIRRSKAIQSLEALINDGWILASFDKSMPLLKPDKFFKESPQFHKNIDSPTFGRP